MTVAPRVVFITQARTGSTRLPDKVMKVVEGKSVLHWFLKRALRCATLSAVCVATTEHPHDDCLAAYVRAEFPDVHVARGSEQDVLSRYILAARETDADIIVRVTSDCPFFDWDLTDRCVRTLIEKKADAVRTLRGYFPIGLDVEVFTRHALETAQRNADEPAEREHVGPYIFQTHSEEFAIHWVKNEGPDWPECRLTLDYPEDFELVQKLYAEVGPEAPAGEYRRFLKVHPEVAESNLRRIF